MTSQKEEIRSRMRKTRSAMEESTVRDLSRRIHNLVRSLPQWEDCREVLLYTPVNNEVSTWPLLEDLWQRNVRTLLPSCRNCEPGTMQFLPACCREELVEGAFDILEPDPDKCFPVSKLRPDIIILPGLAFDQRGYRLGQGKGYYDRFLASMKESQPLLVGLAYGFQVVSFLPTDPWDQPVHTIITERTILWTDQ